ncbi:hypothetical protein [Streptomyces cinereospinus]|uniref:Uncharacterized protein n=1 Tax=Streptomyces cinereospinus TaxID=285561 RepID=A0ABV5NB18_9ACTN
MLSSTVQLQWRPWTTPVVSAVMRHPDITAVVSLRAGAAIDAALRR